MSIKKQHHDRKLSIKSGSCDGVTNSKDRATPPLLSSLLHLLFMPFSLISLPTLSLIFPACCYSQFLSFSDSLTPSCSLISLPTLKAKDVKNMDMDVAFIWVMIMAAPPLDPLTSPFGSTEKNQMPTLIWIEPISFPPVTRKSEERLWITLLSTEELGICFFHIYRRVSHLQQEVRELSSLSWMTAFVNTQLCHFNNMEHTCIQF